MDRLSEALKSKARPEALSYISSVADFRDAVNCLVAVLRHAKHDQDLVDAAGTRAAALFRGGWLQNRQLPSLMSCLQAAGHETWAARFCRHAVARALQTGDWSDFHGIVQWFVHLESPPERRPADFGLSKDSLAAIWHKLSEPTKARIEAAEHAVLEPLPNENDLSRDTPITQAIRQATDQFAAAVAQTTPTRLTPPPVLPSQPDSFLERIEDFDGPCQTPNQEFEAPSISGASIQEVLVAASSDPPLTSGKVTIKRLVQESALLDAQSDATSSDQSDATSSDQSDATSSAQSDATSNDQSGITPSDQLRELTLASLREKRARVATKALALPANSPERAQMEKELARLDKAIKDLP